MRSVRNFGVWCLPPRISIPSKYFLTAFDIPSHSSPWSLRRSVIVLSNHKSTEIAFPDGIAVKVHSDEGYSGVCGIGWPNETLPLLLFGLIRLWDVDVILRSEVDWHDQKAHASIADSACCCHLILRLYSLHNNIISYHVLRNFCRYLPVA
jgi:hypothetical protein